MSGIEIRHLRAAIAVAEKGSFTKAAIALNMTQPNLSKQVQELEDYLGVVLFIRSNQGVILTEPCETFLEDAELLLFALDRAVEKTRALGQGVGDILNFGSSPYVDPYLVSVMLSVRLPNHPELSLRTSNAYSEELCRQVLLARLDVALVASGLPDPRLNFFEIATRPFYVVFRDQDRLARSMTVSLNDFHERVWILFGRQVHPTLYDQLRRRADELGTRPRGVHHVTSAEQAACLIHHHGAFAFLTEIGAWRIARDGLTMRPLADKELVVRTDLVTRADDESQLIGEFLRAAVPKLQQQSSIRRDRLVLAG